MRVAICSVGTELVSGHVVDTNAAWLARRVLESGCAVVGTTLVGDDRAALVDAFRWLADRADVLIVGGGLGPTVDDLTRDAIATFAGVELERRPELVAHLQRAFARFNRPMPPSNLRQADVPPAAMVHPPLGTAAGFALDVSHNGRSVRVHALPGVPWEFREMAERHVLPELVRLAGGRARVTRTVHVAGMGESAVDQALGELSRRIERAASDEAAPEHGIEIGFLAQSAEVLVRLMATGPSPQIARERLTPILDEVTQRLGEAVSGVDERKLEHEVARLLRAHGMTVCTAETVTAGRVAAFLSSVPDMESFLLGAVVACADRAKVSLLGLEPDVLARHGDVGPEITAAMATAARQRLGTDLAIATTGVAGTVYWAVAGPGDSVHSDERFIRGDRETIQARGAAFALESLRRQLLARAHRSDT